jgi:hypothetical protein
MLFAAAAFAAGPSEFLFYSFPRTGHSIAAGCVHRQETCDVLLKYRIAGLSSGIFSPCPLPSAALLDGVPSKTPVCRFQPALY